MTYFLKSGNTFKVSSQEALDLHEVLPPNNYIVRRDAFGEYFLEQIASFDISCKLYGDIVKKSDRIIRTFTDRDGSTGVMLSGEKGSGKTLLGKYICFTAAKMNIPTIMVNASWHGDGFNSFIQSINQTCIVLFDEFEKVYSAEEQEHILTLLDGVFPSKKLFLLTCNDKFRVNIHMRNRPGRIYYLLDFKGLEPDFIREYCEDVLIAKKYIDSICRIASLFDQFNFDMLKALVEEMNRYDESPQEVLKMLNAKPEFNSRIRYKVEINVNEVDINEELLYEKEWVGTPLTSEAITISIEPDPKVKDDSWKDLVFKNSDLTKYESINGKFVFVNDKKERLTLTKIIEKQFTYGDLF